MATKKTAAKKTAAAPPEAAPSTVAARRARELEREAQAKAERARIIAEA